MKVRIHANSIRFRLKEEDIGNFLNQGKITEVLTFGAGERDELSFALEVTDRPSFSCRADGNRFVFYTPQHIVHAWLHTGEAGLTEMIDTGMEKKLKLIVEKDFPCDHEHRENKNPRSDFIKVTSK